MVKKKKYRGHFCKVCRKILPNEKFSGKGHAAHICKKCIRKSKAQKSEEISIACIYSVLSYGNLSRDNRKMLENYTHSRSELVRSEALTVLTFTRPAPSNGDEDFPNAD